MPSRQPQNEDGVTSGLGPSSGLLPRTRTPYLTLLPPSLFYHSLTRTRTMRMSCCCLLTLLCAGGKKPTRDNQAAVHCQVKLEGGGGGGEGEGGTGDWGIGRAGSVELQCKRDSHNPSGLTQTTVQLVAEQNKP